jgi:hypothetical protein
MPSFVMIPPFLLYFLFPLQFPVFSLGSVPDVGVDGGRLACWLDVAAFLGERGAFLYSRTSLRASAFLNGEQSRFAERLGCSMKCLEITQFY